MLVQNVAKREWADLMIDLYGALDVRARVEELRPVHVQPRGADQIVACLHVRLRDPYELRRERFFRVLSVKCT